jgi:hypothetical protein
LIVSASFCKSSSEAPRGIWKRTSRFAEPFEVSLFDFWFVLGAPSERFDDAIVWLLSAIRIAGWSRLVANAVHTV